MICHFSVTPSIPNRLTQNGNFSSGGFSQTIILQSQKGLASIAFSPEVWRIGRVSSFI